MGVKIKLLNENAKVPTQGTARSAACDIYAVESVTIAPGERVLAPCGFALELPIGFCALILPRSGLGVKHGIGFVNSIGLIDNDYRGEVKATLINHGDETFKVEVGDRIAQIMIIPWYSIQWVLIDELGETERGDGGFGSTGLKNISENA